MIEKLAKKLVAWQVKRSYLSEKDSSLYTYAYELLIGQALNLLIACLLAVVFNAYLTVIVFLLTFIPLRSYAGGHHADSYNVCTIISNMIICMVCIASKIIPAGYILLFNIVVGTMSGIIIFQLAPVEDQNKPLDAVEGKRYKTYSRFIWIFESIIWIVGYCMEARGISLAITLGHLSLSILLWAGIIKNKYLLKVH